MTFNLHRTKREARREAWYGEGTEWNPFKKTRSNTLKPTLSQPQPNDTVPLSPVGEPLSPQNASGGGSKEGEGDMTNVGGHTDGRPSDPESESTVIDSRYTQGAGPAKNGLFSRFHKKKHTDLERGQEEDDAAKKRPWYKGKDLKHEPFTVKNQLGATIFGSWINILLLAAPVGIALNYAGVNGTVVFVVNFIAIIPLAGMLSFATEEIALHVGESLGGLLNATFGNAVEMIVAIIALAKGEVTVVQTSLIGSILSNLLLVMGMCFFFGGLRRTEQFFNETVAQTAASLLALAVGSALIPTCFNLFSTTPTASVAAISRGTSVILLVVYIAYLYFQLSTHSDIFNKTSEKVPMRPRKGHVPDGGVMKSLVAAGGMGAGPGRAQLDGRPPHDELVLSTAFEDADEEPEMPQLHIAVAWATLAGATAIIGLCAEFMVDGISAITSSGHISVEFVGLILLPIVGNAAEHATAVTVACKDKMDLAIGVAVGSSMQVALFLIPLLVVIGWIMGNDCMTLSYDGFQVVILFVAIFLVNYLIMDGKSHWLEGLLLQCLYLIIAVCAWYYPVNAPLKCSQQS